MKSIRIRKIVYKNNTYASMSVSEGGAGSTEFCLHAPDDTLSLSEVVGLTSPLYDTESPYAGKNKYFSCMYKG